MGISANDVSYILPQSNLLKLASDHTTLFIKLKWFPYCMNTRSHKSLVFKTSHKLTITNLSITSLCTSAWVVCDYMPLLHFFFFCVTVLFMASCIYHQVYRKCIVSSNLTSNTSFSMMVSFSSCFILHSLLSHVVCILKSLILLQFTSFQVALPMFTGFSWISRTAMLFFVLETFPMLFYLLGHMIIDLLHAESCLKSQNILPIGLR